MVNLGLASKISSELIRRAVSSLTKDRNRRALLSKNGKVLIDARGIFRVIDIISSCT
jgi:spore coat polysaccharide biosynthesis predicted glycosyltransferase SpsG